MVLLDIFISEAQMNTNNFLAALGAAAAILTSAQFATAQTIYPGVQYQYGAYGEIFYGGQNPDILTHPYLNIPPHLIKTVDPRYTGPSAYYGVDTAGNYPAYLGAFPATRFNQQSYTQPQHFIFSDQFPYVEVGQYGYTEDDAHNEAYANVPRYQVNNPQALQALRERQQLQGSASSAAQSPAAAPPPAQTAEERQQTTRAKAAPLLNWAKAEHARGHDKLVEMLTAEAAKFDPQAANAFRLSLQASASDR
jgi:hypothetical protein